MKVTRHGGSTCVSFGKRQITFEHRTDDPAPIRIRVWKMIDDSHAAPDSRAHPPDRFERLGVLLIQVRAIPDRLEVKYPVPQQAQRVV